MATVNSLADTAAKVFGSIASEIKEAEIKQEDSSTKDDVEVPPEDDSHHEKIDTEPEVCMVNKSSLRVLVSYIGPCRCGKGRVLKEWKDEGTIPILTFDCGSDHILKWHGTESVLEDRPELKEVSCNLNKEEHAPSPEELMLKEADAIIQNYTAQISQEADEQSLAETQAANDLITQVASTIVGGAAIEGLTTSVGDGTTSDNQVNLGDTTIDDSLLKELSAIQVPTSDANTSGDSIILGDNDISFDNISSNLIQSAAANMTIVNSIAGCSTSNTSTIDATDMGITCNQGEELSSNDSSSVVNTSLPMNSSSSDILASVPVGPLNSDAAPPVVPKTEESNDTQGVPDNVDISGSMNVSGSGTDDLLMEGNSMVGEASTIDSQSISMIVENNMPVFSNSSGEEAMQQDMDILAKSLQLSGIDENELFETEVIGEGGVLNFGNFGENGGPGRRKRTNSGHMLPSEERQAEYSTVDLNTVSQFLHGSGVAGANGPANPELGIDGTESLEERKRKFNLNYKWNQNKKRQLECAVCGFKADHDAMMEHNRTVHADRIEAMKRRLEAAKPTKREQDRLAKIKAADPQKIRQCMYCDYMGYYNVMTKHYKAKHPGMTIYQPSGKVLNTSSTASPSSQGPIEGFVESVKQCIYCDFKGSTEEISSHYHSEHPEEMDKVKAAENAQQSTDGLDVFKPHRPYRLKCTDPSKFRQCKYCDYKGYYSVMTHHYKTRHPGRSRPVGSDRLSVTSLPLTVRPVAPVKVIPEIAPDSGGEKQCSKCPFTGDEDELSEHYINEHYNQASTPIDDLDNSETSVSNLPKFLAHRRYKLKCTDPTKFRQCIYCEYQGYYSVMTHHYKTRHPDLKKPNFTNPSAVVPGQNMIKKKALCKQCNIHIDEEEIQDHFQAEHPWAEVDYETILVNAGQSHSIPKPFGQFKVKCTDPQKLRPCLYCDYKGYYAFMPRHYKQKHPDKERPAVNEVPPLALSMSPMDKMCPHCGFSADSERMRLHYQTEHPGETWVEEDSPNIVNTIDGSTVTSLNFTSPTTQLTSTPMKFPTRRVSRLKCTDPTKFRQCLYCDYRGYYSVMAHHYKTRHPEHPRPVHKSSSSSGSSLVTTPTSCVPVSIQPQVTQIQQVGQQQSPIIINQDQVMPMTSFIQTSDSMVMNPLVIQPLTMGSGEMQNAGITVQNFQQQQQQQPAEHSIQAQPFQTFQYKVENANQVLNPEILNAVNEFTEKYETNQSTDKTKVDGNQQLKKKNPAWRRPIFSKAADPRKLKQCIYCSYKGYYSLMTRHYKTRHPGMSRPVILPMGKDRIKPLENPKKIDIPYENDSSAATDEEDDRSKLIVDEDTTSQEEETMEVKKEEKKKEVEECVIQCELCDFKGNNEGLMKHRKENHSQIEENLQVEDNLGNNEPKVEKSPDSGQIRRSSRRRRSTVTSPEEDNDIKPNKSPRDLSTDTPPKPEESQIQNATITKSQPEEKTEKGIDTAPKDTVSVKESVPKAKAKNSECVVKKEKDLQPENKQVKKYPLRAQRGASKSSPIRDEVSMAQSETANEDKSLKPVEAKEKSLKLIETKEKSLKLIETKEKSLKLIEAKEKSLKQIEAKEKRLKQIEAKEKSLKQIEPKDKSLKQVEQIDDSLKQIEPKDKSLKQTETKEDLQVKEEPMVTDEIPNTEIEEPIQLLPKIPKPKGRKPKKKKGGGRGRGIAKQGLRKPGLLANAEPNVGGEKEIAEDDSFVSGGQPSNRFTEIKVEETGNEKDLQIKKEDTEPLQSLNKPVRIHKKVTKVDMTPESKTAITEEHGQNIEDLSGFSETKKENVEEITVGQDTKQVEEKNAKQEAGPKRNLVKKGRKKVKARIDDTSGAQIQPCFNKVKSNTLLEVTSNDVAENPQEIIKETDKEKDIKDKDILEQSTPLPKEHIPRMNSVKTNLSRVKSRPNAVKRLQSDLVETSPTEAVFSPDICPSLRATRYSRHHKIQQCLLCKFQTSPSDMKQHYRLKHADLIPEIQIKRVEKVCKKAKMQMLSLLSRNDVENANQEQPIEGSEVHVSLDGSSQDGTSERKNNVLAAEHETKGLLKPGIGRKKGKKYKGLKNPKPKTEQIADDLEAEASFFKKHCSKQCMHCDFQGPPDDMWEHYLKKHKETVLGSKELCPECGLMVSDISLDAHMKAEHSEKREELSREAAQDLQNMSFSDSEGGKYEEIEALVQNIEEHIKDIQVPDSPVNSTPVLGTFPNFVTVNQGPPQTVINTPTNLPLVPLVDSQGNTVQAHAPVIAVDPSQEDLNPGEFSEIEALVQNIEIQIQKQTNSPTPGQPITTSDTKLPELPKESSHQKKENPETKTSHSNENKELEKKVNKSKTGDTTTKSPCVSNTVTASATSDVDKEKNIQPPTVKEKSKADGSKLKKDDVSDDVSKQDKNKRLAAKDSISDKKSTSPKQLEAVKRKGDIQDPLEVKKIKVEKEDSVLVETPKEDIASTSAVSDQSIKSEQSIAEQNIEQKHNVVPEEKEKTPTSKKIHKDSFKRNKLKGNKSTKKTAELIETPSKAKKVDSESSKVDLHSKTCIEKSGANTKASEPIPKKSKETKYSETTEAKKSKPEELAIENEIEKISKSNTLVEQEPLAKRNSLDVPVPPKKRHSVIVTPPEKESLDMEKEATKQPLINKQEVPIATSDTKDKKINAEVLHVNDVESVQSEKSSCGNIEEDSSKKTIKDSSEKLAAKETKKSLQQDSVKRNKLSKTKVEDSVVSTSSGNGKPEKAKTEGSKGAMKFKSKYSIESLVNNDVESSGSVGPGGSPEIDVVGLDSPDTHAQDDSVGKPIHKNAPLYLSPQIDVLGLDTQTETSKDADNSSQKSPEIDVVGTDSEHNEEQMEGVAPSKDKGKKSKSSKDTKNESKDKSKDTESGNGKVKSGESTPEVGKLKLRLTVTKGASGTSSISVKHVDPGFAKESQNDMSRKEEYKRERSANKNKGELSEGSEKHSHKESKRKSRKNSIIPEAEIKAEHSLPIKKILPIKLKRQNFSSKPDSDNFNEYEILHSIPKEPVHINKKKSHKSHKSKNWLQPMTECYYNKHHFKCCISKDPMYSVLL